MLDWFRGEIPFQHPPLPSGQVMSFDPDGSMEWMSSKRLECRSSHETNIMVKSAGGTGNGFASSLLIDGNLSKFLQGHNVFGSRDMNLLVLQSFQKFYSNFEEHLDFYSNPEMTEARIKKGDYLVKMFDVNSLFDVGNDQSVESMLHSLEMKARTRTGRALRDKGTLYLQKHSRRWALKMYNKYRELMGKGKSHQLPDHLNEIGLEDFVKGKIRIEARFMSLELKDLNLTHGYHFTEQKLDELFNTYLGRMEMNAQFQLIDESVLKLPRPIQSSYKLWEQGICLKNMLPESTFYRHRKQLLAHGIDITLMCDKENRSNVVPFRKVIEAKPVSIPQWAHDQGLIVC